MSGCSYDLNHIPRKEKSDGVNRDEKGYCVMSDRGYYSKPVTVKPASDALESKQADLYYKTTVQRQLISLYRSDKLRTWESATRLVEEQMLDAATEGSGLPPEKERPALHR